MPRPKGAGRSDPRLGRALNSLIRDVERDCSDADIARLIGKIKRLTERGVDKSLRKGGCVQVGAVIPPEGLIAVQAAQTAAKALDTLEVIQARRVQRVTNVGALFEAIHGCGKKSGESAATGLKAMLQNSAPPPIDGDDVNDDAGPVELDVPPPVAEAPEKTTEAPTMDAGPPPQPERVREPVAAGSGHVLWKPPRR